jgi:alkylation response protein AidB-like acyl-CoA dehydrogenase
MADLYIRTRVAEITGMRATALGVLGVTNLQYGGGGAASRLLASETRRVLYNTAMQILGPYGQLTKNSKYAPFEGEILKEYMDAPRLTIVHGSVEIQKLNIARSMGLPRRK